MNKKVLISLGAVTGAAAVIVSVVVPVVLLANKNGSKPDGNNAVDPNVALVHNEKGRLSTLTIINLPAGTANASAEVESALRADPTLNLNPTVFTYTFTIDVLNKRFNIVVSKGEVTSSPAALQYDILVENVDPDIALVNAEKNRISQIASIVLPFGTGSTAENIESAIIDNDKLNLTSDFTYNIEVNTFDKNFSITVSKGNVGPSDAVVISYAIAQDPDIALVANESIRLSKITSVILPLGTLNEEQSVFNALWQNVTLRLNSIFNYNLSINLIDNNFTLSVSKGNVPAAVSHTIDYTIQQDATDPDIALVETEKNRLSDIESIELPIGTINSVNGVKTAINSNATLALKSEFTYVIEVDVLSHSFSLTIQKGNVAPVGPIVIGYTIAIDPNVALVEEEVARLDGFALIELPDTTINNETSVEAAIRTNEQLELKSDFNYLIIVDTFNTSFTITVSKGMALPSHPVTIQYSILQSVFEKDTLLVAAERQRLSQALSSTVELPQGTLNTAGAVEDYIRTMSLKPEFDYVISVNIIARTFSITISRGSVTATPIVRNYTIAVAPIDYVEIERARLDAINSILLPYSTESLESLIRANSVLALNNNRFTYDITVNGNASSGGSFTIVVNETGKPSSAPVSINFTMSPNPAIALVNERISSLNAANARPIFAHDDVISETTLLAKYTFISPYSYTITDLNTTAKTFTITVTVNGYSAKTNAFSYFLSADPQVELDYYVRNQVGVTTLEDKLVSQYLPMLTHTHTSPLDFANLKPFNQTVANNMGLNVVFAQTTMNIEFFYFLSKSANESKENTAKYILRIVGKHQLQNGNYIYSLRQNYELQSSDVLPLTNEEKAELDLGIMTQWLQNKNLSATIAILDTKVQGTFVTFDQNFATENNLGTLPQATNGSTYQYKFVKGPEQAGTNQTYSLIIKAINGTSNITSGDIVISSTDINEGPIDPSMQFARDERARFIIEILDASGEYHEKSLETVPTRGTSDSTKIMSAVFTPQNNVAVTYNTESVDANFEFAIIKVTFSLNGFSISETYKVFYEKHEEIKEIVDEGKLLYKMKTQQLIYDPWKAKLPDKIVAADWAGLKLEELIGTVDFDPSDPKYSYVIENRKSYNNDDGTIVLGVTVRHVSLARVYWTQVSIKGLMRTSQNRTNIMYSYINGKLVNGEAPTNIQGANTRLPSNFTNEDFAEFDIKVRQPMALDLSVSNLPLTGLTTQWTIVSTDDANGKLHMRVIMRHGVDYIENNIIDVILTGFKRA